MTRTYRFNAAGEFVEVGDKPLVAFLLSPEVPRVFFRFAEVMAEAEENMRAWPPIDPNSCRGVWGTKG